MNFFEFDQNNSGGSFDVDDKICHRLFIEAESSEEATEIAESLGCYWDGCAQGIDCNCCGDRWSSDPDEVELPYTWEPFQGDAIEVKTIEEYAQYEADTWGWTSPDGRIFYKNGKVIEIFRRGDKKE